jgi:hypothetical protein
MPLDAPVMTMTELCIGRGIFFSPSANFDMTQLVLNLVTKKPQKQHISW